jgi:hypothetical protein
MIRLKIAVPVVLVSLLMGGWLLGDDKKADTTPPPARATLPANWKKLGLTDQQKREVYSIRGRYAQKIDVLKQQIADLQEQEKGELEKVLTEAQRSRLKEIKTGEPTAKEKKP